MSRLDGPRRSYLLAAFLAATSACGRRGEPEHCLPERQQARNLALQGHSEEASRLLENVKANCGPNSASDIQHVSKLIAEKAQAKRAREQKETEQTKLRQQWPSRDFVAWATEKDGAVTSKLNQPVCAVRGTPDFGFCEVRRPSTPNMSVRYSSTDLDAYRYTLRTATPPSCIDLGEYRELRAWTRDESTYELCELTSRRLRHLTALLIHRPGEHEMHLFSQEYPALDTAFEHQLRAIPPPK